MYLDPSFREQHKIQLDGTSKIFHNLHGAERELDLGFGSKRISNWEQGTKPQVLHGNGPTKISLNRFGNYHPKVFDPTVGYKGSCLICEEKEGTIDVGKDEELPTILTTLFISGRGSKGEITIDETLKLPNNEVKFVLVLINYTETSTPSLQCVHLLWTTS